MTLDTIYNLLKFLTFFLLGHKFILWNIETFDNANYMEKTKIGNTTTYPYLNELTFSIFFEYLSTEKKNCFFSNRFSVQSLFLTCCWFFWSRVCPVVHRMIYIDYISVIQEMIGWFQMFWMNWVDKTEWTRDHGTNSTSFFFLLLNKLTYLLIMFWISMEAYYLFLFFPNRSCCPITFHDWLWNSWTSYRINQ